MRLRARLERLELVTQNNEGDEAKEKLLRKVIHEWMENDPQAIPLFKQSEDYCRHKGYSFNGKERQQFVEADPVAQELQKKWQDSYLKFAEANYGGMLQ